MNRTNGRLVYLYGSQAEFNEPEDRKVEGLPTMRVFADRLTGEVMKLSEVLKLIRKEARRFCSKPKIKTIGPWGLIMVYLTFGEMVRQVPLIQYASEALVGKTVKFGNGRGGFAPFFGGVPGAFQKVSKKLAGKYMILRSSLDQYQQVADQYGGNCLVTVNECSFNLIAYSGGMMAYLEMIQFDEIGK